MKKHNSTFFTDSHIEEMFKIESMHRLRHPGQAAGALHAERDRQCEVQGLAGGRGTAFRVLYHDTHRTQHHSSDDESESIEKGAWLYARNNFWINGEGEFDVLLLLISRSLLHILKNWVFRLICTYFNPSHLSSTY